MPTTSIDYDLADALAEILTSELTGVTVEVVADPTVRRETLSALCVRVIPAAWEQATEWRDENDDLRRVHVAVVGPADVSDLASVKAGLILVDQVKALWAATGPLRFVDVDGHRWQGPLIQDPLYRQDLLLQQNLFVAIVIATYVANS